MKLKILSICLLAILLLGTGSTEVYAQRKATKKTTSPSTKTTPTSKATATQKAPALNCDSLAGQTYLTWTNLNNEHGLLTYSEIEINKYYFDWYGSYKDQFIGTWGVSGNKLRLKSTSSAPITYNLESNNGGKSFTGTFVQSAKNYKGVTYLYEWEERNAPMTENSITELFKDGKAIGFLNLFFNKNRLELGVPVTVSFVYDDDNDKKGYIKLQSSAAAFPTLGLAKVPFVIGETALTVLDKKGKEESYNYNDLPNNHVILTVGDFHHPSFGKGALYLYLIPNPDK